MFCRSPSLPDVVQCTVTASEPAFLDGLSHVERCYVSELDEIWADHRCRAITTDEARNRLMELAHWASGRNVGHLRQLTISDQAKMYFENRVRREKLQREQTFIDRLSGVVRSAKQSGITLVTLNYECSWFRLTADHSGIPRSRIRQLVDRVARRFHFFSGEKLWRACNAVRFG